MNRKTSELRISVPWGHIAAKTWGDENDEHVLVAHGRMDNAGSFDRLIPLLPNNFYYICFELPGHGKSSPLPPFFPIHTIDYLLVYKIVVEYFKKKSYIFLGHSYGGIICLNFARLYPQYAKKMIIIDGVVLLATTVQEWRPKLVTVIDEAFKIYDKSVNGKKPTYTYEEALKKVQESRQSGRLTVEQATPLLIRAIEPLDENKYSFTVDQRMKIYLDPLHDFKYSINSLRQDPLHCPILFILPNHTSPLLASGYPAFQAVKEWKQVSFKFFNGGHDIHITDPEAVAEPIKEFMLVQKSKI